MAHIVQRITLNQHFRNWQTLSDVVFITSMHVKNAYCKYVGNTPCSSSDSGAYAGSENPVISTPVFSTFKFINNQHSFLLQPTAVLIMTHNGVSSA